MSGVLGLTAILWGAGLGVTLGVVAALHRGRALDYAVMLLAIRGVHPQLRAMNLTETFSAHHMTPARRLAAKLIIEMPADIKEGDRIDYIMSALDNDETITDEAHRDVVVGILEDYKVLQGLFESYIEKIDETTLQGRALRLEDGQKIPDDLGKDSSQSPWSDNPPIPVPRIDDLIKTFSTKGEGVQGVGLETAMIVGAVTLAKLKTTPYHDAAAQ